MVRPYLRNQGKKREVLHMTRIQGGDAKHASIKSVQGRGGARGQRLRSVTSTHKSAKRSIIRLLTRIQKAWSFLLNQSQAMRLKRGKLFFRVLLSLKQLASYQNTVAAVRLALHHSWDFDLVTGLPWVREELFRHWIDKRDWSLKFFPAELEKPIVVEKSSTLVPETSNFPER